MAIASASGQHEYLNQTNERKQSIDGMTGQAERRHSTTTTNNNDDDGVDDDCNSTRTGQYLVRSRAHQLSGSGI